MSDSHSTTSKSKGGAHGVIGGAIIMTAIILTLVFLYVRYLMWRKDEPPLPAPAPTAQAQTTRGYKPLAPLPSPSGSPAEPAAKTRGTTPATLTLDYGFSIEADGLIGIEYPREKPFIFDPSGPTCKQLPQPRFEGPKKFFDPRDPENGHVSFRIYRGAGKC